MHDSGQPDPPFTQFASIGTGFSAIGLGATLQRWYGLDDIQFFDRQSDLGGTWFANSYPGCGCDVPAILYSFSFSPNVQWTKVLPPQDELWQYLNGVAENYRLRSKMRFRTSVQKCEWIESTKRWRLHLHDDETSQAFLHECQFLFSGTGGLVEPNQLDIPGLDSFKGEVFHTARWRHDVDLHGKRVAIFGNGCTASQVVPCIVERTKHLTQFVRSKHWVVPPVKVDKLPVIRWIIKHLPGAASLLRFCAFCVAENDFRGFYMTKTGEAFRRKREARVSRYMKRVAPEKYHQMLIPDFNIGCKRRVFDSDYLQSLNAENLTLTNKVPLSICSDGIVTEKGLIETDVIILANGFRTNLFMPGIEVMGRRETAVQHWDLLGGAGAYETTAMNGFPNFFLLLGPNSATGHTSTIMAAENSINLALRVIKPILDGKAATVEIKLDAEKSFVSRLQEDLRKTVFGAGCSSWYIEKDHQGNLWNASTYPYSQAYMWFSSLFPTYSHWEYSGEGSSPKISVSKNYRGLLALAITVAALLGSIALSSTSQTFWDMF